MPDDFEVGDRAFAQGPTGRPVEVVITRICREGGSTSGMRTGHYEVKDAGGKGKVCTERHDHLRR